MKKDINTFFVANRNNGIPLITFSLVATIIGASSGIGIAGKFYKTGFPAIWWLLSGAFGLLVLAFFFINKINIKKNFTLPELLGKKFGIEVRIFSGLCIFISWIGIISAQILAGGKLLNYFFPYIHIYTALIIIGLFFTFYTIIGGQKIIIQSDLFQFLFLFSSFIILFYVSFNKKIFFQKLITFPHNLTNENINYKNILEILIIVGFPYLIGPDIYSRLFSSKSIRTARYSLIFSAIIIFIIGLLIFFIVEFNSFRTDSYGLTKNPDAILFEIINYSINNSFLKIFIIIGLLSLIMSSADTCLLSAGTIFTYDIINQILKHNIYIKNNLVNLTKLSILLLGSISIMISIFSKEIISNLFLSYTIYTVTLGGPALFMLLFDKLKINKNYILLSIILSSSVLIYLKFFIKSSQAGIIGLFTSMLVIIFGVISEMKSA